MTPPEWQVYISIGKDIVTAGAALTAAVIAVLGLQAWKRQLRGKTDYELARRFLRAVYSVRDSIRALRNPVQNTEEIVAAFKDSTNTPQNAVNADDSFKIEVGVYQLRWKRVNEAMSDLQVEMLEAEVSWGEAAAAKVEPFRQCVAKLHTATRRHLRYQLPPYSSRPLDPDAREALDRIIYEISNDESEDGTFTNEIKRSVETIEGFLKPRLKL